jgi:phage RecT family recombinase
MSEVAAVLKNGELVERFDKLAPQWMRFDAEYGFAIQHLKANDSLRGTAERNPNSLMAAMSNVAACGLTLNPAEKQAYLIPRKGVVCLDPSYMGLCKLATDTGSILWVQAAVVHEQDQFEMQGVDEKPIHKYNPFSKDRGKVVGVYCTAKTHNGDYLTTAMDMEEIEKIKNSSEAVKAKRSSPWDKWFGEMAKKVVIRRAFKTWPRSDHHAAETRLANAIEISNLNEGMAPLVSAPDTGKYSDKDKEFYDQLIQSDDTLGMYVFTQTIPSTAASNLYNSWPKGQTVKYKRIVDDMTRKGMSLFDDYLVIVQDAKRDGDDLALQEVKGEVSEEVWELLEQRS